MSTPEQSFGDAISRVYQSHLVPLIFEPYATLLASRVARLPVRRVLEVACGTGVVTRALATLLPDDVEIVATDLSDDMLREAERTGTARPVTWQRADALALPFDDASFDAVVCQFGAMFFPDRLCAYAEARRVLHDGGTYCVSTWDRIETNAFPDEVMRALAARCPEIDTSFMTRIPHGHHDTTRIVAELAAAGFTSIPAVDTVTMMARADSAAAVATAFCEGTPLRTPLERAGVLADAVAASTEALVRRFGAGPIEGAIQAHVVTVAR